ncbi:arylsulfatase B-like [Schistocerca nitens]|uniref:arylsulfatase B-like n=1 Tax=Schistocerca nitens TaxID=7011 RepID=UPI002117B24E|nr:arylsulfatase B-like [Schistocerca nitens]
MRFARGRLHPSRHAHTLPHQHRLLLLLLLPILTFGMSVVSAAQPLERPHIVFILADDLGWNDVGFHGSDEIPTPNIDALAYHGVILNSHYVQPLCTPSRAALLTGKYPLHTGMQHLVILEPEPWGLPLNETLLPQRLRGLGYATHAVGKWHLGFYQREYTPTYRGFDSHFGFWNGFQDYYDHTVQASFSPFKGYDMRRGLEVDYDSAGRYSTDAFSEEAERVIARHDASRPLFLYLAHLAPHAANPAQPLQPPPRPLPDLRHIGDPARRAYAAMVWRLDESVGRVVSALERRGLLENSLLVFASDNGAATSGVHANHGSNWPLRGMKGTPWEGGVRGVAAVWSPRLKPRVSRQLMHITDWMPTLYSAAGGDVRSLGRLDGVDMWPSLLRGGTSSPRRHVLINIDDREGYAALRVGNLKYVNGTCAEVAQRRRTAREPGISSDSGGATLAWLRLRWREGNAALDRWGGCEPAGLSGWENGEAHMGAGLERRTALHHHTQRHSSESSSRRLTACVVVLWVPSGSAFLGFLDGWEGSPGRRGHYNVTSVYLSPAWRALSRYTKVTEETVAAARSAALVECPGDDGEAVECDPLLEPCLFDVEADPCERRNLYRGQDGRFGPRFEEVLDLYRRTARQPLNVDADDNADPARWNNTWTTWGDFVH